MKRRSKRIPRLGRAVFFLLSSLLFAAAVSVYAASKWIGATFGIGFEELLFTLAAPLKGADTSVVWDCVKASLSELKLIAAYTLLGAAFLFLGNRGKLLLTVRFRSRLRRWDLMKLFRRCMALFCAFSIGYSLWFANTQFQIMDFVKARLSATTLYEDYYIDPSGTDITGGGKNLIYIYMESMETTYASLAAGGRQSENNYMPNLTALAKRNTSFSDSRQLGGFHAVSGAMNTISALFSSTSGIPCSFPGGEDREAGNNMGKYQEFASGVTNLGDILEEKGYQNEFLCGSDASFAARREYFTQHGSYKIFDLLTARETGYVPPDYFNGWWGFEDMYLYEIAKDELLNLSRSGKPFNLTLLTVDTHHVGGYICPLCGEDDGHGLEDSAAYTATAVSCADRQVMDFLAWCREQDFYKDTVIVVTGDHPRMDTNLVENVSYYDRTVYNCFLNCDLPARTDNREFTTMDLFPTVLAAMGFQIEGDRLGLGANLFSDKPTLCEELGYDALNAEIRKYSPYFIKHFA